MSHALTESEHAILSIGDEFLPPEARLVRDGLALTLTQQYAYTEWLARQLEAQYDQASCSEECAAHPGEHLPGCPEGAILAAYRAAESLVAAARDAWLASDEEREYLISAYDTTWAISSTPGEIEADVEAELSDGDWGEIQAALRLSATAYTRDPVTGKRCGDPIDVTAEIEPEEPDCAEGEEHDWCAPASVVGGLRENPGVWGRGAGIVTRRVCSHCGTYQVYESARQDPENGGYFPSTSYEEADEESLAWVEAQREQEQES